MLGLALTPWMSRALKLLMPPGPMVQLVAMDTRPNFSILAFAAGVCVLAAIAAGLVPALQVGRINLSARLNAGGRSGTASRRANPASGPGVPTRRPRRAVGVVSSAGRVVVQDPGTWR